MMIHIFHTQMMGLIKKYTFVMTISLSGEILHQTNLQVCMNKDLLL